MLPTPPKLSGAQDLHALPLLLVASIFNHHRAALRKSSAGRSASQSSWPRPWLLCVMEQQTPRSRDGKKTTAFRSPSSNSKPKRMTLLIPAPGRSLPGRRRRKQSYSIPTK